MKKFLSIILALCMMMSVVAVVHAEEEAELFDTDTITKFEHDVIISLPMWTPVTLTFPKPINGGAYTFYAVNRDTSEEIRFAWVDYNEIYDDNYWYVTGLEIYNIDTYGLTEGEYDLYVINNYPKETFGPVMLVNAGYSLLSGSTVMTNQPDRVLEYYFDNYMTFAPKSVDIEIKDYSGNTVFSAQEIPVDYSDELRFGIRTAFPVDVESGSYMLSTWVNTFDGDVKKLATIQIILNDGIFIDTVGLLNECMTDVTPYYYAVVNFDHIPEDLENFYVEVVEQYDDFYGPVFEVVSTSDRYYIKNASSEGATVYFRLPPPENKYGYYNMYLRYNGDREIVQEWGGMFARSMSDYSFDGAKWISEDEYQFVVRGLAAGEYNLWFYEGDTEPIGVLTVGDGEIATAKFNRKADWYDSCNVEINGEYRPIDLWNAYKERGGIEVELGDVNFLVDSVKEISRLEFNIISGEKLNTEDIKEVNLLRDGEVIARGSLIDVFYTEPHYSDVIKRCANVSVGFEEITSPLRMSETLQLQVKTTAGEATTDIYVEYSGYANPTAKFYIDGANAPAGYVNGQELNLYTGTDVKFRRAATYLEDDDNIQVYLYKCDPVSGEQEDYITYLTQDDLTISLVNNYVYSYSGEFKNLESDCLYCISSSDGGWITYFRTTDKPLFVTYDMLYVYDDMADVYVESVNVSDSATIKAYYINDAGNRVYIDVTKSLKNGKGSLSFDFSGMDFSAKTIYLTCNNEAAGAIVAYDMRGNVPIAQLDLNAKNGNILAYSTNPAKYTNPILKISPLEVIDFHEVVSNTAAVEVSVKFKDGCAVVSPGSFNLKDGYYAVSLWDKTQLVSDVEIIYIDGNGVAILPELKVNNVAVSSGEVTVKIENTSEFDAEEVEVLLAAYDANDIMIGVISATKTITPSGETLTFDKIDGAKEYKVYVWNGIDSMIPLAK